ncbi:DUF1007 family protein [Aliarcobacter butzleri]|uniref:DUF1007 family protein n=1 Tax=Aliarcobacter butzleri TaxID=28197 RepID=A0AAW7QCJ8_9BACT|nr:DUF1007 family protein [Aliarcobacter butzleri]MCP3649842.1 DUF1007 family protein [Arcobacter sp. DNRA7]MCR1816016.1 DUF1007 family protein [Aliarcobacter butzleri]MDN5107940.1 DUF1007 family protein [Aliarcobacter butzleri]MDN5123686.1 DUF1007 family protein [Aliarcobacter butzleri]
MKSFIILFFVSTITLFAHPHTFIDIFPKIYNKENIITSISMMWKFDEMTSELLLMEFDENGNGKIDEEEQKYIKENYFDSLKDYKFYTYLFIDKKPIPIIPKNFKSFINKEKRIVYIFDFEINSDKNNIYIDFYDSENFTAFILKKEFVKGEITYRISGTDKDFYYSRRLEFK